MLRLVVAGLRNKEIAAQLGISENTVKFHLRNILDKLHAQNRAEVVARAMRERPRRGRLRRATGDAAALDVVRDLDAQMDDVPGHAAHPTG